uniref:molybdate ABC transporter substrate-binding protein n=1 Tax=Brachybacterium sp. YJGR34 TaxID=2059911 RepID=UPI000E0AF513
MTGPPRRALATAAAALLLAGCGPAAGDPATGSADGAADTTLVVFAAASLEEPVRELGARFEDTHPGLAVELSIAGSSTLVTQIQEGAAADVIATADTATMDQLVTAGLTAQDPVPLATNTLRIAVPAGNPAEVTDLASLTREGTRLVVCAPAVPCGAATGALAEAAGLELSPVSEEQSVTDVLGKVRTGEADAGLVYATDIARAGGDVEGLD